ncbi:MAG: hypothetical protein ACOX5Z_00605 [Desulfobulbus sp.]|jgi:hypothetical protein
MHTDEYEISLNRELRHCTAVVNKIKKAIDRRQQQFKMTYEEAIRAADEGRIILPERERLRWQDDIEALPQWEQRLDEYRKALAVMRISASRF